MYFRRDITLACCNIPFYKKDKSIKIKKRRQKIFCRNIKIVPARHRRVSHISFWKHLFTVTPCSFSIERGEIKDSSAKRAFCPQYITSFKSLKFSEVLNFLPLGLGERAWKADVCKKGQLSLSFKRLPTLNGLINIKSFLPDFFEAIAGIDYAVHSQSQKDCGRFIHWTKDLQLFTRRYLALSWENMTFF